MNMIRSITGKLAFWMAGSRAETILQAGERWWGLVAGWLRTPMSLGDALTAPMEIVDLLAYQRGIDRFASEPERMYRLRVHHALVNARDAGTHIGMNRIFERLEMAPPNMQERIPGFDWDMLALNVDADYLAVNAPLLDALFTQYARTCRRWIYNTNVQIQHATPEAFVGLFIVDDGCDIFARCVMDSAAGALVITDLEGN